MVYPVWVFRLNIPKSSIHGSTNNSDCVDDNYSEGVQLLQKDSTHINHNNYGLSPPLSSSQYLAELCPHGCSVSTLSDNDSKNQTSIPNIKDSNTQNWSWSYSSQSSPSQWNVTSSKLLSVTYRPVHEAYPSYTNISMQREVWHKSVGTCCGSSKSKQYKKNNNKWDKMKRSIIFIFALLTIGGTAIAQQLPQFTSYQLNPFSYNPAFAGVDGTTQMNALIRNQWSGVNEAPETNVLNAYGLLHNEKMAIGGTAFKDAAGPDSRVGLSASYAYHLKVSCRNRLDGLLDDVHIWNTRWR